MRLGTDFRFRDDIEDGDTVPIELISEPYAGVVFRVLSVSIQEMDGEQARLSFQFKLIHHPNYREQFLRSDMRFNELIGLVINALVLDLADQTESVDDSTEAGTLDIEEPDTRTRVRS